MGHSIVFTGPAMDGQGRRVLRTSLEKAASAAGLSLQDSVTQATTLLVASRLDTVKARKARQRGVEVIGYPQFIATYLRNVELGYDLSEPNAFTDKLPEYLDPALVVPVFLNQEELAALDVL